MSYGYFPGCSLHSTAKEYDLSIRSIFKKLNLDIKEVEDWNCCGATPAHVTKEELGIALPYSNLYNAAKQNLDKLVAPCAACYNRLKTAEYSVSKSEHTKDRIEKIIGGTYNNPIKIFNILEVFRDVLGYENIKNQVAKPLTGIKAACYYGCLLVRPAEIVKFDNEEDPTSMDELVYTLGGTSVDWAFKTECCGGNHAIPQTEIVLELCKNILKSAAAAGADCICVACPLCQANLDMRQKQINKKYNTEFNIPILYITQLVGVALGIDIKNLGFQSQFISAVDMLSRYNLN